MHNGPDPASILITDKIFQKVLSIYSPTFVLQGPIRYQSLDPTQVVWGVHDDLQEVELIVVQHCLKARASNVDGRCRMDVQAKGANTAISPVQQSKSNRKQWTCQCLFMITRPADLAELTFGYCCYCNHTGAQTDQQWAKRLCLVPIAYSLFWWMWRHADQMNEVQIRSGWAAVLELVQARKNT
jgi:hypothetical protein